MSAPDEDDEGLDEVGAALRERLHQAVSSLEPVPGTLDYLRRAVPARRRRRNAALAATAVSVFAVSAGATLAARGSFDARPSAAGGANVGNLLTTATDDAPGGGSSHGPTAPGGQDMTSGGSAATEAASSLASASGTSKPSQTATSPSGAPSGIQAAAGCQNSSVSAVTASQNLRSGITYETFVGTVRSACTLVGMPILNSFTASGTPADVQVFRADQTAAPLLPVVPGGQTLALQPGDRFEFQFEWIPYGNCGPDPTPSTPPSSLPSTPGSPTTTASSSGPTSSGPTSSPSGQPTPSGTPSSSPSSTTTVSVEYAVAGSQPAQTVSFPAPCYNGGTIYVTDYFRASK